MGFRSNELQSERHSSLLKNYLFKVGDRITGGDVYATVEENSLLQHRVMLPPGSKGIITFLAPPGEYNIHEKVIEIEFHGQKKV